MAHVLWLSAPRVCLSREAGRLPSDHSERLLFPQQLYPKLTCAIIGVFLILTIIMGHFLSSFLKYKWFLTLRHFSKKNPSLESFSSTFSSILEDFQCAWSVTATKSKCNKNETYIFKNTKRAPNKDLHRYAEKFWYLVIYYYKVKRWRKPRTNFVLLFCYLFIFNLKNR